MKRFWIIIFVTVGIVYFFSLITEHTYVEVFICLLGLQLFGGLTSIGESKDEIEELEKEGNWFREWHAFVILLALLIISLAVYYHVPMVSQLGASKS